MASRTIVIGDIHGCISELHDLLGLAELKRQDRVIAVGDLITKGESSAEVLELFIKDRRFSSVLGNHDRALRRYWQGEPVRLTAEQRKTEQELERHRRRYAEYLNSLPFTLDLDSHLVVHGGVRPGVRLI